MDEEITYSDRGFAQWPEVEATHGAVVQVNESSAAMGPHCWLRIRGEAHLDGPPTPLAGLEHGTAPGRMDAHLTVEQAEQVRDMLTAFIEFSKERWEDDGQQD